MSSLQADSALLVTRAAGGDSQAFGELIDPLAMRLLLFIRARGARLLGSDCDAEDVLQKVLLRAWELFPQFEYRGPESVYRWLTALARGTLSDRIKYLQAKGRGSVRHRESLPGGGPQPYDPATSVTKLAARRDELERVAKVLAVLEPKQRDVVERHLLGSQTLSEIAAELGISKNAVWERLHRGTARLRAALGEAA